MDDSLDLPLGLGPDRDHVAARADGHDRLADRPRKLGGAQHRVQPFPHPILRGPQPPPNGGQLGRGGVQDLAALIDAADDPRRELGRGIEVFTQTGQMGLRPASKSLLEASGGLQRVGHLEQICRLSAGRHARPGRAIRGCHGRRRSMPVPGRRAAVRPRRSGPGAGRRARPRDSAPTPAPAHVPARSLSARPAAGRLPRTRVRAGCPRRPRPTGAQRREMCGSSAIQKRIGRSAQGPA